MKTKNISKIKILIFLSVLITISVLAARGKVSFNKVIKKTAQAVGDLTIDWGVPAGQPIFKVDNFLPGQTVTKEVHIFNGAANPLPIAIVGVKTNEIKNLGDVLEITISKNDQDLYGGTLGIKNLNQFFQNSQTPNAIFLFNLNPASSQKLTFRIKFKENAGNYYQGAKVVFDIYLGIYYQLPEECRGIKFSQPPIFGTAKNDVLNGTNGNDLIFGFGGNDEINGSNGDDCLVGGDGRDIIDGGNGNDIILGQEENDNLEGSNGDDIILGGNGHDIINGSNGNDRLFGNNGNDQIKGGNGNDHLDGGEGNDNLEGGNSDDILIGGVGNDKADGGLNYDKCDAESKTRCEY